MGAKHTPGPWRISGCQLGVKLLIEHGIAGQEFTPIIGSVYTDEGRLPQQANARLIAAAPDLLAIVKRLVQWEANPDRYAGDLANLAREALTVIAKVEPVR